MTIKGRTENGRDIDQSPCKSMDLNLSKFKGDVMAHCDLLAVGHDLRTLLGARGVAKTTRRIRMNYLRQC